MPQFAPHFPLNELRCRCGCTPDPQVQLRLARLSWALEQLRHDVAQPVTVISGHRCRVHNAAVGGAFQSRHMEGDAADICTPGYTGDQLHDLAEEHIQAGKIPQGGLGTYASKPATLHYDQRGYAARWRH